MRRKRTLNEETVTKALKAHLIFVSTLTIGAFFRIAMEDSNGNSLVLSMVLAMGVIIALSLFNKIIIDIFNSLNFRRRIINYCMPGILWGVILLVFKVPVELLDVLLVVILMLVGDLLMYASTEKSNGTRSL
jgi:hypothetical protein